MADWNHRQIQKGVADGIKSELEKQRAQDAQRTRQSEWDLRLMDFTQKHPDAEAVILNPALPLTADMFEVAQASEMGPDIVYHLGKNPDKAARIARLSPQQQMVAIGRLEAELSQPAPKPQSSKAPPPPNPVDGSATPSVDPSKMSIDDWMKWRVGELRKRS